MFEAQYRFQMRAKATSVLTSGLLILCAAFPVSAAPQMGRLFFYPAERMELNRARTSPFACLTVSGLIIKGGEKLDDWTSSGFGDPHLISTLVATTDSRAGLEVHVGSERTVVLRPGQSLDMVEGAVHEAFETDRGRCMDQS